MQLIEKTKDLENFCQILNAREFICVDLEFMRERTYFAKLCSIQIASVAESAVIDPLAPGLNLTSFFNLMQAPSVTKVFHSGRQDIEIIYNLCGKIPAPLFDTQIAAQALGFGEAVSYETLVNAVLHIELDKSSRLSDWSKRPLNENQLRYALSDVTHLVNIYQHIRNELQKQHRLDWIAGEIEALANPEIYRVNPREAWQKIRHRSSKTIYYLISALHDRKPKRNWLRSEVFVPIWPPAESAMKSLQRWKMSNNWQKKITSYLHRSTRRSQILLYMNYLNCCSALPPKNKKSSPTCWHRKMILKTFAAALPGTFPSCTAGVMKFSAATPKKSAAAKPLFSTIPPAGILSLSTSQNNCRNRSKIFLVFSSFRL